MPAGTKTIQRRIKSVSNTKKITKAMEMVSAAKMRKATSSVLATRPYSDLAWQIIGRIKKSGRHPLFASRKTKSGKELLILVSSDRGLCGGFNSQLFREIKNFSGGRQLECVVLGKKGEKFAAREKFNVTAVFENLTNNPKFTDVKPVAKMAMQKFADKTYDRVFVAYTDYKSTLVQKPRVKQLLPVKADKELGSASSVSSRTERSGDAESYKKRTDYIFEPQGRELLKIIVPKIVETQVFQAILESVASEHSARMVAMRNATDAANEMVDDLRFTFNKIRQASITREISEISAGKAALE